jgi:predicted nucleic-acid-binding protein
MTAADTNILVRFLTEDDQEQAAAARRLFAAGPVWLSKTVLLETAWVLRSIYGFEEAEIRQAFVKLLGLPNVHAEDARAVAAALALAAQGVELADAVHLSSRPAGAAFATFDKALARRARRAGENGISVLS